MDSKKNIKLAKEIFARHSKKNELHFTSDGTPFFSESDAKNHAETLKDKERQAITRSDVMATPSEEDNKGGDDSKPTTDAGDEKPKKTKASDKSDDDKEDAKQAASEDSKSADDKQA